MAGLFKRGGKNAKGPWYATWTDAAGKERSKSTRTTDKSAAQLIANKYETDAVLRRERVIDPTDERNAKQGRRPLAEHVSDYRVELSSRQNTHKHVRMTIKHIETIIAYCEAKTVNDLTGAAV